MKGEKLMKTASQIKKDLISLYGDYEKKRIANIAVKKANLIFEVN